jgi:iduronate 2-sulfatase
MPHYLSFLSLILVLCLRFAHAAEQPPLVLLIIADDLRPALGCYDDPKARTPHVDALAQQGVQCDQAFCQQAVCAPSRMSMLSGLRPESIGIFTIRERFRERHPTIETLPSFMKSLGYETVSLGKVYHHDDDDVESFDHIERRYRDVYHAEHNIALHGGKKRPITKPWQSRELFRAGPYEHPNVPDSAYEDYTMTTRAIELLDNVSQDQPLFLAVGYRRPHLPFNVPQRWWDAFAAVDFTPAVQQRPDAAPPWAMTQWGELRSYHGIDQHAPLAPTMAHNLARAYFACVAHIDAQIGRLLAAVRERGLDRQAVIVLWGDHGYKLGDYGDWAKHTNLHIDTRTPLLIQAPGCIPGRCQHVVEVIDIFPTVAGLLGQSAPSHCEGVNHAAWLQGHAAFSGDGFAVSVYPKKNFLGYSITDGHWRYTVWLDKKKKIHAAELYDHRDGVLAERNLIAESSLQQHRLRLHAGLQQRLQLLPDIE